MPRKKQEQDLPCCGCCEYFTGEPMADYGRCRRFPPALFVTGDDVGYLQPMVEAKAGWCGEWRRRVS